jgi:hypothetical protein
MNTLNCLGVGQPHWPYLLIAIPFVLYPLAVVLRKMGFNGWWALASIIPGVAIFGLYILAFTRWSPPTDRISN